MNYRFVIRQLGLLWAVLSLSMAVPLLYELIALASGGEMADEWLAIRSLGISAGMGVLLGGGIWLVLRRKDVDAVLARREAMLLVASSWVAGAAFAAMPFWLWAQAGGGSNELLAGTSPHPYASFTRAYFEAMSGLSTTGSTVLGGEFPIADIPKGLLLWRSMTHWLGGLGIIVLFVAVLPSVGSGAKKLFAVESTADKGGVRPRIAETARVLWMIYFGLTVAAVLLMRATGAVDWFEAVNHAFSVMSTGGLSTHDASIGGYNSISLDIVLTLFMFLAGVNFVLYYHIVQRRWNIAVQDVELRIYFLLKVVVTFVIAVNLMAITLRTTGGQVAGGSFFEALRFSSFQTMSMQTGTGFATSDFDQWPTLSKVLLIGLMFVGGCAGSTAGGLKVIRLWICIKVIYAALERAYRPNVVRPIKIGKTVIDDELKLSAMTYFIVLILITGLGTFALLMIEAPDVCSFQTAGTASLASICNVGPGLGHVGPSQNYGWMSPASLWVLSLLMALGRLEVYALLVLLVPRFWRGN